MPSKKPLILLGALLAVVTGFITTAAPAFAASGERVLYSLCPESGCVDGDFPIGGVIFDSAGNLYGTAYEGGTHDAGTVYELSPEKNGKWTQKLLHTFDNSDGSGPEYSMIFDTVGNLYGTTMFGGPAGGGVVFQLKPGTKGWTEQVLHGFVDGSEGFYPIGLLTIDAAGNLYGTTYEGGSFSGAVYQLSPSVNGPWNVKVLHSFAGGDDGANPGGGVIFDAAGNLYGTTYQGGGSGCGGKGCGIVFELSPSGNGHWREKVLHTFNGMNGANPGSDMIFDGVGNLYGTTINGGRAGCDPPIGCGTVFELSPGTTGRWTEKVLRSFYANPKKPRGKLVFDTAGNLYGTTSTGAGTGCNGAGCGKVFKLTPAGNGTWTYSTLHIFLQNGKDGNIPYAGMVLDSAGNLYGTTYQGGSGIWNIGCGAVFEITP
jgi:uncharacterized repeat protein (TIGR03803 family)